MKAKWCDPVLETSLPTFPGCASVRLWTQVCARASRLCCPIHPVRTVVDIRGGAPGTRETDALDPASLGVKADAIVISGGSAFGLDAASGVMAWLSAEGRGFELRPGTPRIPIVPAAVIFDFSGDAKFAPDANPYARLGREAVMARRKNLRSAMKARVWAR